jgi:hypothetical protein
MIREGDSAAQASKAWDRVNHAYRRQVPQRWGADYEPAIRAVPGEAPAGSTPMAFRSCRLGRTMHALSKGEAFFIALALHHPAVWDVHEQHILHPFPSGHPFAAHPTHRLRPWPSTIGTLKLLDGWGYLARHPYVSKPAPAGPAKTGPAAADRAGKLVRPWIGDLLVFVSDERGPYVVEWDVKDVSGKHGKPWAGDWKASNSKRTVANAELRDRAYQRYMEELGIPIRRVAKDQIDLNVLNNLIRLMARNQQPLTIPQSQVLEVEYALQDALKSGETPARALRRVVAGEQAVIASLQVLDRAIWDRRLRVDLTREILNDRPLHPETVDLLAAHADLFAR